MKKDNEITLDLKINHSSTVPLNQQVKKIVKKEILKGRYQKGERLPSIKKLCRENLVSAITIEKAYRELLKEGFITRKKGDGYFVLEKCDNNRGALSYNI